MKKKNLINLIKYHVDRNDVDFRNEAYEVARIFQNDGDDELARYIMALLSDANTFSPQYADEPSNFFSKIDTSSDAFTIPISIQQDITGILNAIDKKTNVNRFLFVGESGTGKTEAAKQIAKLLNRSLYSVQFDRIIDSKLGQTSKNLATVFDDINNLKKPESILILFDEIDALALDRINSNDLREMGRVTSTLLRELDQMNNHVTIIATSNLFNQFDKALIRRFDFVVDFNKYTKLDLITIANNLFKTEVKKYPQIKQDPKLLNKIFTSAKNLPYPGELKNIIRSSIAFSSLQNEYSYLAKIYEFLIGENPSNNLKKVRSRGFTVREIEKITGISKSSVCRGINNE